MNGEYDSFCFLELCLLTWLHYLREEIYEKLDEILKRTKEVNLTDLDMSSFRIDNYIEVYLKKAATFAKPFATILGRKENDFTPVYLKVYIKRLSSCKEELPEIREINVETTPTTPVRQMFSLEYDPTVNGSGGSSMGYTPSNISNSEEGYYPSKVTGDSSNGYVPKPISPEKRDYVSSPEISPNTIPPQYKASKISKRDRSPRPITPVNKKKMSTKEEARNDRAKRGGSTRKDQTQKRSAHLRSDMDDEDIKPSTKKRNLYPPPEFHLAKNDDQWKTSRSSEFFFLALSLFYIKLFFRNFILRYLGIIYIETCCFSGFIQGRLSFSFCYSFFCLLF